VITTGDRVARVGEEEIKSLKRLIPTSNRLDIRTALALVSEADLIVGPETGIMNCAANIDKPKVVFLSHSTELNLTKYWKNTTVLKTNIAQCYPCHILHSKGFETCFRDNGTGAALCQATILPDITLRTIEDAIDEHSEQKLPRAMSGYGKGSGNTGIGTIYDSRTDRRAI
jgi:hypothetical protein